MSAPHIASRENLTIRRIIPTPSKPVPNCWISEAPLIFAASMAALSTLYMSGTTTSNFCLLSVDNTWDLSTATTSQSGSCRFASS